MQFDSGRIKDLQMLEFKLKAATTQDERNRINYAIGKIKGQAENLELANARERLLEARRKTERAFGEINISNARNEADKLEEAINKGL